MGSKINGDIVFIDDDPDDILIYENMFDELGYSNKMIFFSNAKDAYEYFIKPQSNPFIIFSDVNMPGVNGLDLRNQVINNPDIKSKCFPYIFITTGISDRDMKRALDMSIQGYFLKEMDYNKQKEDLKKIIEYWKISMIDQ